MTSAAVVSIAGAPGVTTLVCAAAAAATEDRPLLIVEAAASGGSIAARWQLDVRDTVSTTARLAMEVTGTVDLWATAHHPWLAGARAIPAHPSPVVMRQAQAARWLAERLGSVSQPVLIDAGRVDGSVEQFDLLTAADSVWLLVDPIVEQVVAARAVADWLNKTGPVELLLREPAGEPARHSTNAAAAMLRWPIVATVPHDPRSARALCGLAPARRSLARAPLLRTGKALADRLAPVEVPA
jgi:MinD-like ATPase involved in chromosome partitioning or flagellar assembly